MKPKVKVRRKPPAACKACGAPVPEGWRTYCSAECLAPRGKK